jgi:hypothetical protein
MISHGILPAVACPCLKEQMGRIMYGTISAQRRRPIFLLSPYPCIAVQFQSPAWLRRWLHERLFEQKPEPLPVPAAPTRFYVALFTSKIEATIRNIGNMTGWEDDNNVVGSIAAAAKQSLLRLIPHIIPADSG